MKKPILTIFYQFNPWHSSIGGIQTIVRSFIKYAPPEFKIRLVGTGIGDEKMPVGQWHQTEFAGRELLFFPLLNLPNDNVRQLIPTSVRYTWALLRHDLSSDFMHFHRLEPALAALRWCGNKLLYIHNDIHQKIKFSGKHQSILWQSFPWLYFAFEKALIQQFDTILSCNSESTKFYQQQYPLLAQRIYNVRNAVDDEIFFPVSDAESVSFRQALAQELNLSSNTKFFLFAGRLHPQKDPLLLVQAMAVLNDTTTHLLIAGEGELAASISREVVRLNLSCQVTLLGAVDQTRLSTLYLAANAFVLSSVYEGLPVVALESLACGTPVITTQAGDTPNLLTTKSGIVCEERSAEAIAQAMEHLLKHPELYPKEACTKTVQAYKSKHVVKQIYSNMLETWRSIEAAVY